MTAILLLERNHRDISRLVFPDALHVGHAGLLQGEPDVGGAEPNRFAGDAGRHAEDDRIVSIKDVFDFDHRLIARSRSVVTRPLAERSFGATIFTWRDEETFDR